MVLELFYGDIKNIIIVSTKALIIFNLMITIQAESFILVNGQDDGAFPAIDKYKWLYYLSEG